MIDTTSLKKAWALLDRRERVNAFKVLAVMLVAALSSAALVGSVFPFLSVLADPGLIETSAPLAWAYAAAGFTSAYGFLMALGFATLAVIVVANGMQLLNTWAMTRYTAMRTYSLSRKLLSHYLAQPYAFYLDRHSGDMGANILDETRILIDFMRAFAGLLSALLTILAVLAMLISIEPVIAISALLVIASLYGLLMLVTRGYLRAWGRQRAMAAKKRFRTSNEALTGIKDVKLLGYEASYLDRFSVPSLEVARLQVRVSILGGVPGIFMQTLAFGGIVVLCLALLDPSRINDRGALGEILPLLGVLAFAGQRLVPQIQAVYGAITQMIYSSAAVDRVHEDLFEGEQRPLDRSRPAPIGLRDRLEMEEIRYTYPNADRPGLDGVGLTVRAGERIGIVGSSGAGKTTLADLVLGLLTPDSGTIRVDGTEITAANLRAWQRSLGYVPQDIFLIDASLAENIALGLTPKELDRDKVEHCARIAQLHAFVEADLPEGYDTFIGERGVRLSGGQRQRVGIARALYHDADVIVFDEATSALDNLTEREVMASIEALPGDKTILMIAHRLTTVKVCDRIVVMEQGRVTGCDSWDALMASNAAFQRIARAA